MAYVLPTSLATALVVTSVMLQVIAAEELQLTNAAAVHGGWHVAEVELYADDDCSAPLAVDLSSAHSSPVPAEKSWRVDVANQGQDCSVRCREGFCNWCGLGNACCMEGQEGGPPECRHAVGFTTHSHECVAVAPHGPLAQEAVQDAFDGQPFTAFHASCPGPAGCAPGTLVLGASLGPDATASARCVVLKLPAANLSAGDWQEMAKHVQLWRRPSMAEEVAACPGICRSGRYLEGGSYGVCTDYLGQHGWCGTGPSHRVGTDCTGCLRDVRPWEALEFRVSRSELLQPTRADAGIVFLRTLRLVRTTSAEVDPSPRALGVDHGKPAGVEERLEEGQALLHVGEDCWSMCSGKAGYCSWCGLGNACCRKGSPGDPGECREAYGFGGKQHHVCARTVLLHVGEDCWGACGGKSGYCDWCGLGNACCRQGFEDGSRECQNAVRAPSAQHECARLSSAPAQGSLRGSGAQAPSMQEAANATLGPHFLPERPSIEEDVLVVRLWVSVCILSAALGAATASACLLLRWGPRWQRPLAREDATGAGDGACLLLQQRQLAVKAAWPCGDSRLDSVGCAEVRSQSKKVKAIEWVK